MTDTRVQEWIERDDKLFGKRGTFMSLCQEIGYNFYPERADFTIERTFGNTFAENLMTSYPLLARRELGNAFGSMLRPTAKEWFNTSISREDRLDDAGRRWLYNATQTQRRAMYAKPAQFLRATKEGDHDFAGFGQAVISVGMNRGLTDLLFRNWHLRDVVWCENAEGKIDHICRKWKLYAKDAMKLFPKAGAVVGSKLRQIAQKDGYQEVELRHIVMAVEDYEPPAGKKKPRQPYVSIYIDTVDQEVLEEVGSFTMKYVIPRWQTVSGSQYAYSPATIAALPDARLIQAMTLTLLEAGEMGVRPPLVITQDVVRSDMQLYAGGTIVVDQDYDERTGDAVRPLKLDTGGIPLGRDLRNDVKESISECFYLNKLNMPNFSEQPEMTAYEVGQRMQEFIRTTMPLFEPMETDYNGGLCEMAFEELMRNGAFGPSNEIPPSIAGADIQFRFVSPLSEAIEAQKGQKFAQMNQMIAMAVQADPSCAAIPNAKFALRDTLIGIGIPPTWTNSEEDVAAAAAQQQKAQAANALLDTMQKSADVAQTLGGAAKNAKAGGMQVPSLTGQAA